MIDTPASQRISKITVPKRAHPLARHLFAKMAEQGISYTEMESRSGVKKSTFKALRTNNAPGIPSIQSLLRVVRTNALPVAQPGTLPTEFESALAPIAERFGWDDTFAALSAVAASRHNYGNLHD